MSRSSVEAETFLFVRLFVWLFATWMFPVRIMVASAYRWMVGGDALFLFLFPLRAIGPPCTQLHCDCVEFLFGVGWCACVCMQVEGGVSGWELARGTSEPARLCLGSRLVFI